MLNVFKELLMLKLGNAVGLMLWGVQPYSPQPDEPLLLRVEVVLSEIKRCRALDRLASSGGVFYATKIAQFYR
jgi:hypothetical protein